MKKFTKVLGFSAPLPPSVRGRKNPKAALMQEQLHLCASLHSFYWRYSGKNLQFQLVRKVLRIQKYSENFRIAQQPMRSLALKPRMRSVGIRVVRKELHKEE